MDIKVRAIKEKVISDLQEISQALHHKSENQEQNKERKIQIKKEAQTVPTTSKEVQEKTMRSVITTQPQTTHNNQPTNQQTNSQPHNTKEYSTSLEITCLLTPSGN